MEEPVAEILTLSLDQAPDSGMMAVHFFVPILRKRATYS